MATPLPPNQATPKEPTDGRIHRPAVRDVHRSRDPVARPYFLATVISYVNAQRHLGLAYTTIIGDALTRWHRLLGEEVHYLTGTDEHGLKIQQAAEAAGMSPQAFTDSI